MIATRDGHRFGRIRLLTAIGVGTTLALILWLSNRAEPGDPKPPPSAESPGASVVASVAQHRNVSVALKGIGVVQAYNTVTVKPRIGGQVIQVVFSEGQRVHQGDVLARIDARLLLAQLHQAQAARAKDEAQLANAKRDLARLTDVSVKGFVSRQLVDGQQAQVSVLEASVQADEAALENARVQLDYATITAPIEGITGIRMADVGNIVSPSDPGIVVITQIQPIFVVFSLPADVLRAMSVGQATGTTPVEAFDRDDKIRIAAGQLTLIDNQIDRTTNTVRLKAVFENADNTLRPGEFVNAHLLQTVLLAATVVPKNVVQYDEQGTFAWLIQADGTVHPRRIKVGPVVGEEIVINEGLAPGDRLVLDGQYNLRVGMRVASKQREKPLGPADSSGLGIP